MNLPVLHSSIPTDLIHLITSNGTFCFPSSLILLSPSEREVSRTGVTPSYGVCRLGLGWNSEKGKYDVYCVTHDVHGFHRFEIQLACVHTKEALTYTNYFGDSSSHMGQEDPLPLRAEPEADSNFPIMDTERFLAELVETAVRCVGWVP